MVFQKYALWPHMTVWNNIAFGLQVRRRPRDEIARRVDSALELVGLPADEYRRKNQAAWNRMSDGSHFARLATDHGGGWIHLTTRQNAELHWVDARDVPAVLTAVACHG